MPWRVPPGADRRADPYHIWLSEVMLQQTTVAAVRKYFIAFTRTWPTVHDLAGADDDAVMAAWAGLGYYARARNLLKCARVVSGDLGGRFPDTEADLLKLPGIGPYTAAAIASIAFDRAATVLDGNVERVMARLHDIHTPLPAAKPELHALATGHTPDLRPGDYAQAVMDLGATICTPRSPACGICPVNDLCVARINGTQSDLPKKTPKKPKPTRRGVIYVAQRDDGTVLMERRPESGLLGGTIGFPTTDWSDAPSAQPPHLTDWVEIGEIRHTFTHFHLILTVLRTTGAEGSPSRGDYRATPDPDDLPSLMRKVWLLARDA